MTKVAGSQPVQIDRFFAGPGARGDQWQNLVELAEAWSDGSGSRAKFETALGEMAVTEGFYAYPGLQLMTALRDQTEANDAQATARLARHITRAILTRSYRQNTGDWEAHEEGERITPDVLPPTLGRAEFASALFRGLDCHGCARGTLARTWYGMAPPSPGTRFVHL